MSTAAAQRPPITLGRSGEARLGERLRAASARARRDGCGTLAAVTAELDGDVDPSALVCASRRPAEPWMCLEQPARAGRALTALGAAIELRDEGASRFGSLAERWRGLTARACADRGEGPEGSGPVALGGLAFAPDGARTPHWRAFGAASLVVPEVSIARAAGRTTITVCAMVEPDDDPEARERLLLERVASLRGSALPLLDPAPAGRYEVLSAMPPEHYEQAVARAVEMIRAGGLSKIVLSREVQVHAGGGAPHFDPAAVLGVLREEFASCFVFCVGRGEDALIAASPELLVRRQGQRVSTLALAASMRRSADPAVDAHLGEQLLRDPSYREEHAIVANRIERTLRPVSVWVAAAEEPALARIANIQHLATPIRAQLASPMDALELAGLMHPTPAVGGEPREAALGLIPALEGYDRGWYAGPVGWTDSAGDGEFCVALRCALLSGTVARCYAGGGIVRDSVPEKELAETEVKLQALLPLLSG